MEWTWEKVNPKGWEAKNYSTLTMEHSLQNGDGNNCARYARAALKKVGLEY